MYSGHTQQQRRLQIPKVSRGRSMDNAESCRDERGLVPEYERFILMNATVRGLFVP